MNTDQSSVLVETQSCVGIVTLTSRTGRLLWIFEYLYSSIDVYVTFLVGRLAQLPLIWMESIWLQNGQSIFSQPHWNTTLQPETRSVAGLIRRHIRPQVWSFILRRRICHFCSARLCCILVAPAGPVDCTFRAAACQCCFLNLLPAVWSYLEHS